MSHASKVLAVVTALLLVLSVSATYYKTIVLEDFSMTGVWVEFYDTDYSYLWFVYGDEEYELEVESAELLEITAAVAKELSVAPADLEPLFIEKLETAYDEATGAYVEFLDDNSSYVWLSNEHLEYEFESQTTDLAVIEETAANELGLSLDEFKTLYLSEQLSAAYEYAVDEAVGAELEEEEMLDGTDPEETSDKLDSEAATTSAELLDEPEELTDDKAELPG